MLGYGIDRTSIVLRRIKVMVAFLKKATIKNNYRMYLLPSKALRTES
jgi:hypothetical protein